MGLKKTQARFLNQQKNSVQRWASSFGDFSCIWSGYKMQLSGRQSVHRKLLGMTSYTSDFFQTGEILW